MTKESGQTLNQVEGVSEYHQEWGSRTFYAAVALLVLSAIWFWLDTKPTSLYKKITGAFVVLACIAATTATVLAGHSGAAAVWESSTEATSATSTPSANDTATTIALTEVAQHSTAADCWSVVNGNVYELTTWISQHPGGSGPIESMCGVDATTAFNNQHNGQGDPEAELASLQIGIVG